MSRVTHDYRKFIIFTAAAWMISGFGSAWFLSSPVRFYLDNGFIALAFVGLISALIISYIQCLLLDNCQFVFWFLATTTGLGLGSFGATLGYFLAHFPMVNWRTGSAIFDWILWLALLFLFAALSGAPGGFLAGIFGKLSIEKGSNFGWILVSAATWSLISGMAGIMTVVINYPHQFNLEVLRLIPFSVKGGAVGLLMGFIHGVMIGSYIKKCSNTRPNHHCT